MKIKQLRLFLFSGGTFAEAGRRESKRERERETDVIEGKGFLRCYHNLYTCIQVFNEDL